MTPLSSYLQEGASLPFRAGETDCCTWVCTWVAMQTGRDPMIAWRGHYKTLREAYRRVSEGGGWLPTVEAEMAACGLPRTAEPGPGDIGLVETDRGPALAIRTAKAWACKGNRRIVIAPFQTIAAWQVSRG